MHTVPVRHALDVVTGLARSYLFEDVDRDDLAPLAAKATIRRLVRGEFVWRLGEVADEICVLNLGTVLAKGPTNELTARPEVIAAYLGEGMPA